MTDGRLFNLEPSLYVCPAFLATISKRICAFPIFPFPCRPCVQIPVCSAVWENSAGDRFWIKTNVNYTIATQCPCDSTYDPVCGLNDQTYSNACTAKCAGMPVPYLGSCGSCGACLAVYIPVCGIDNRTYGNECEARCSGVAVQYSGVCTDLPTARYLACAPLPCVSVGVEVMNIR